MGIAAAQIGLDHEAGKNFRIFCRHAGCSRGAGNEGAEPIGRNARI